MIAPVTVIIGYDRKFYKNLTKLFPHKDASKWFQRSGQDALDTAKYNCALQTGYLIIAARALGLDCGPISGFDKQAVNAIFFTPDVPGASDCTPSGDVQVSLICNLGYGDAERSVPPQSAPAF